MARAAVRADLDPDGVIGRGLNLDLCPVATRTAASDVDDLDTGPVVPGSDRCVRPDPVGSAAGAGERRKACISGPLASWLIPSGLARYSNSVMTHPVERLRYPST
jgi:hypothetical protein